MSSTNGADPSPKAQEVMDYLATHELTQRLNDIVNNTVRARAEDPFAYMAQQFLAIARPPAISHVAVSTILDHTGSFQLLQADVYSWQPSSFVHMGRGLWQEAGEFDKIEQIGSVMSNQLKLKALKSESLSELDKMLSDTKEEQGAVVIPAVSLAISRALAHATRQDLYTFLQKRLDPEKLPNVVVPLPLIDIAKSSNLNFGYFGVLLSSRDMTLRQLYRAVNGVVKFLQDKLSVKNMSHPVNIDKADALLTLLEEGIKSVGITPGDQLSLWFDASANSMYVPETQEYDISGGASVSRDELLAQYETMLEQHRSLAVIIDPFHHSDVQGWERFAQVMEHRCVAVSSSESISGSMCSLSFAKTVSDYLATAGSLKTSGKDFVVVANDSQFDDALADLAIAVSAKYCRFGLMGQGGSSNLYNRLMQIEELIKAQH